MVDICRYIYIIDAYIYIYIYIIMAYYWAYLYFLVMYHASRQPRFKQMVSVHITSDGEFFFCDIEAMQMGSGLDGCNLLMEISIYPLAI